MPRKRRRRNNQEDPPRGPWGGLGQPGQRAYIPEGMESFKLLLLNRGWLLVCTLAGLFILISAVLIIGPLVGFAAVLLLCALVSWRLVEMAQDSRALAALIVVAHVGWIFAGWRVVEMYWPPVRCAWPLWSKAVLLLFFAVVEWNLFMSGYRHGYETVDANWSPTIEVRPAHWGPLWPWAHIGEVEEPEPQTVVKTESLPRPVPNSGQRAVSPPQTTSGEYYDRVLSPKQHAIYVKHLLEFAALAPKIGATWRTWKDRGWSYKSNPRKPEQPSWTDTVDTWATFGVVTSRDEKCTTTMLVTDPREAAARLRAILDKE